MDLILMTQGSEISADAILDLMAGRLHDLSPRLQAAARYIVDHPGEVGVNSMRKLADLAKVTPNTLTRLAKELGFRSYEEYRDLFRDAVRRRARSIPDRARWLQAIGSGSSHGLLISHMANAMLMNLEQLFSDLDAGELEAAAKHMMTARTAYVIGARGAYSLAHNFYYVARMALANLSLVPRQASTPIDDIMTVGPKDLVLAISLWPYARETIDAARYAKDRGAAILAVTDSRASPLMVGADYGFIAPSGTPQFFNSIVAAAALLESLMAMIVALGDENMLASIRLYDRVRNERKVYWMDRGEDLE